VAGIIALARGLRERFSVAGQEDRGALAAALTRLAGAAFARGNTVRRSVAVGLLMLVVAAACARATTLSGVAADPSAYHDKRITVEGVVASGAALMGRGLYRIEEGSARLWVLTESGVPAPRTRVEVTGRLYNGYDIRGLNLPVPASVASGTVLVESSHRVVD
jgi:hypothetical protein